MKRPGLLLSISPILIAIALLMSCVFLFGEDLSGGAAQIALSITLIYISIIGVYYLKVPWEKIEEGIGYNLHKSTGAILILLMIGALTATWMLSGIVPTMIYYGLQLIHPKVFIVVTFVVCALVSILAGSSWTTVGTIGVAMLGAGSIIGLPTGWVAGAVISGAYMGDKLSPLSDTVNLAAAVAGTDLYTHVRYSMYTAIPAFVVCAIVYGIVGAVIPTSDAVHLETQLEAIKGAFTVSPWLLLIPCLTFFMVVKKIPATITLFISALAAGLVTFFVQKGIVVQITGGESGFIPGFKALVQMMGSPVDIETGNEMLNSLARTKGMSRMVDTIWLVICIMAVGGALSATGMIDVITERLLKAVKSTGSVIATTLTTCIACNCVLADQYMSVLLPGNMFSGLYRKKRLAPEVLSRTLGDSATVSSVLVPWNTCALVQSNVLGMSTMAYFPFSIFCFITPLIAALMGYTNYNIRTLPEDDATDAPDAASKIQTASI